MKKKKKVEEEGNDNLLVVEDSSVEILTYTCLECGRGNNMQVGQINRCGVCDALHDTAGGLQLFTMDIKPVGGFLTGDIKKLKVTEKQLKAYLGLEILQYEQWYKVLNLGKFSNGIIAYKWAPQ